MIESDDSVYYAKLFFKRIRTKLQPEGSESESEPHLPAILSEKSLDYLTSEREREESKLTQLLRQDGIRKSQFRGRCGAAAAPLAHALVEQYAADNALSIYTAAGRSAR